MNLHYGYKYKRSINKNTQMKKKFLDFINKTSQSSTVFDKYDKKYQKNPKLKEYAIRTLNSSRKIILFLIRPIISSFR